jgi:LSD1 subclass zinc finger protein
MPIDVNCVSCQRKLRVPDTAAGRSIKCPLCQAVMKLPAATALSVPAEQWLVQFEDGQRLGPISRPELQRWHLERRLTPHTQLLRDGASEWQWASELFPNLTPSYAPPHPGYAGNVYDPYGVTSPSGPAYGPKSRVTAGLLGLFLGGYGIHRFYLGYTGIGLAMLFTCGGCGIWAFVDSIMIFAGSVNHDALGRRLRD